MLKKNLTRLYSDLSVVSLTQTKRVKYDLATILDNLEPQSLKDIVRMIDKKKLQQILPELPISVQKKINKSKITEKSYYIISRPHLAEEEKLELITP